MPNTENQEAAEVMHGQGGWAGMWLPVVADLARTHRVIAPDLPGLGASEVPDGPPDAARVLAWLDALVRADLPGAAGAGRAPRSGRSIAARFAIAHPDRLSRLVLVDAGSLGRFRPAPGVAAGPDPVHSPGRASAPSGASSGRWRWTPSGSGR